VHNGTRSLAKILSWTITISTALIRPLVVTALGKQAKYFIVRMRLLGSNRLAFGQGSVLRS